MTTVTAVSATTPTTATTVAAIKDNFVLREKICNNEIVVNSNGNYNNGDSSKSPWLGSSDDIDIIKEKLKTTSTQQQINKNNYQHINQQQRYHHHRKHIESTRHNRFSESGKDSINFIDDVNDEDDRTERRCLRTRSESEPNDISNMKYWTASTSKDGIISNKNDKLFKKNVEEFLEEIEQTQYSSHKLPPKYPHNSNRKVTPSPPSPRVTIYSNSARSPGIIRKSSSRIQSTSVTTATSSQNSRFRSSSIPRGSSGCGSPHSNHHRHYINDKISTNRRCRTKSPSPTYAKGGVKCYGSTDITEVPPFRRKAKSVTPPPKKTHNQQQFSSSFTLPSFEESNLLRKHHERSQSSVPRVKYDESDNDSALEDDEDEDFENEINNDDNDVNSSSDSENGYRAHAYTTNFEKSSSGSSFQYPASPTSSDNLMNFVAPSSPLVPSLFPNVPPYLAFSTHIEKSPQFPLHVHKILKWKLTTIMPKVVRRILINSGFRLLKKTNDWMGTWGKHMKSPCFRAIRSYQKINHLPGSFKIGRKDSCWKNLQIQMAKHGKKEFGFMPKTYIIPQDLKLLRKTWPKYAQKNFKWIIKPPASARGTGIKVVNKWSHIPKRRSVIVQKYIERPFLINGSKFDLRLYVLVTSINPLRVYLYHDGLVRFASVKYSEKSDTLSDRCMHLTNYSINKFSSHYAKNEDVYACHGHKWTIKSLWAFFEKRGINTNRLWGAFRNLILRTLLAGESAINAMIKLNVESKYNCFELFGFDILLDSELVPWLLEVNISPSLHSELPLDLHVKAPLVQAVLNTALYHIPPKLSLEQQRELLNRHGLQGPICFDKRLYVTYLSRAEKLKHQQFTKKSLEDRDDYLNDILENLTPDDIRCLVTSEDELSRCSPLERIFPTQHTYKYLKYTESPRYYNRLLDAWEYRYGKDRLNGINLLKDLCKQNLHLDTPPAPMKRQIKIRTRTLMRRKYPPSMATATLTIKSIKRRHIASRQQLIKARMLLKLKEIQDAAITTNTKNILTSPEAPVKMITSVLPTTISSSTAAVITTPTAEVIENITIVTTSTEITKIPAQTPTSITPSSNLIIIQQEVN